MPSASAGAQTKFVAAEVVSLRDDPKFDERWLEKQIVQRPNVLGLGEVSILHSQLINKEAGLERIEMRKRNPAAVQLGRLGGKATAKARTAQERTEQARKAAQTRWLNKKSQDLKARK
jgi:hypothetical protein